MERKARVSPKVVEDYLEGRTSATNIASELGVNKSSIESWIRKYKTFGKIYDYQELILKNIIII